MQVIKCSVCNGTGFSANTTVISPDISPDEAKRIADRWNNQYRGYGYVHNTFELGSRRPATPEICPKCKGEMVIKVED